MTITPDWKSYGAFMIEVSIEKIKKVATAAMTTAPVSARAPTLPAAKASCGTYPPILLRLEQPVLLK